MKNTYIKSPLNYVGGKYKLLPQIIPLFPDDIDTFVDLFGGGFNVGVNVDANRVLYNDICAPVVDMLSYIKDTSVEQLLREIDNYIEGYALSKTNQEGFVKFRSDYNASSVKPPMQFYTLLCYAFNYQIRFNNNGEYNMPFGKNRSSFNPILRQKFISFADKIKSVNCDFHCGNFIDFDLSELSNKDFVYCDPPYYNAVAPYNENGGWDKGKEKTLLNLLDKLDARGIRFALSNNLKYQNPILAEWRKQYHTHYVNGDYSNCNYHKKDRSSDAEVLTTNYDIKL